VTWSTEVANWVTDASKQQLEAEHAAAARSFVVEKFSNEIGVLEAALAQRRREITDLELALVTAKSEIKDLTMDLEDAQERATRRDTAREVELKNLELELEKARSETKDLLMLYNENLCTEQIGISKLAKGLSGFESFVGTQMTCLRDMIMQSEYCLCASVSLNVLESLLLDFACTTRSLFNLTLRMRDMARTLTP
jgi:hypothetical protein